MNKAELTPTEAFWGLNPKKELRTLLPSRGHRGYDYCHPSLWQLIFSKLWKPPSPSPPFLPESTPRWLDGVSVISPPSHPGQSLG